MQSSYLCFAHRVCLLFVKITLGLMWLTLNICIRRKENTTLRAGVDPHRIFVIPHPVDTDVFRPLSTNMDRVNTSDHRMC